LHQRICEEKKKTRREILEERRSTVNNGSLRRTKRLASTLILANRRSGVARAFFGSRANGGAILVRGGVERHAVRVDCCAVEVGLEEVGEVTLGVSNGFDV
jgi:hypothetical protein